jgi:hypothetical protein
MAQVRQCVLAGFLVAAVLPLAAEKFFPDDPIAREPAPLPVAKPLKRDINDYYDFFQETFFEPDKEVKKQRNPPPSQAVNTLGEVPDNAWFTNRMGSRPMTVEELVRGPGDLRPPADGPWIVISGKNEGITPGLVIRDSAGRRYFLKFDPKSNPEMASAADVIGCKFFHDLGYNTPENYIVTFGRERLRLDAKSRFRNPAGRDRPMTPRDIEDVLEKVPRGREGAYRGLASLDIGGDIIGPFRYYGTRKDDPNDVVDHETRRDLRGLFVFAAWLNHTDTKSINSLDTVLEEDGRRAVRHFLIDFGAILGSDSFEAKSPRAGNVYLFDFKPAAWQFLSLGLDVPAWMRARYPHIPEAGHLEYETFDPENWRNNYPNPAFDQRTPGDTYWAAKKVMAFRDEDIRAIVSTGQFSEPRAKEWIVRCLIERRNKIGRAFLNDVLPLDDFVVRDGKLAFTDLAVRYGFHPAPRYRVEWSTFENRTGRRRPIAGAASFDVPQAAAEYVAASIRADDPRKTVTVYLRNGSVVGIDRTW